MTEEKKRRNKISLLFAAAIFPFAFVFFVLVPSTYFSFRHQKGMAEDRAQETLAKYADHVETHVLSVLSDARKINAFNAKNFETGVLDLNDDDELRSYFLGQVQAYKDISSIYFGNLDGGLADAGREGPEDEYYVIGTEDFAAGDFYKYAVDDFGTLGKLLQTAPGFDARSRSWYQHAIQAEGPAWSDVYVLFTGQDMAISSSRPVYDQAGNLAGVTANDIFLGQLSSFLANAQTGQHESFLVDSSGYLIATSTGEALFTKDGEHYQRVAFSASASDVAASFDAQYAFADPDTAALPEHLTFEHNDALYFADLRPIGGAYDLDWTLISIAPERIFFADWLSYARLVFVVLFVVFVLFTLIFSTLGARWLLLPLVRLEHAVKDFSLDEPRPLAIPTTVREIESLTASFNEMVLRLAEVHDSLKTEIIEHELAREKLAFSEARYRSSVEDLPGLVCSFLPDGRITFVNQNYADFYQQDVEDLIGINFLELLPKSERQNVIDQINMLNADNPVIVVNHKARSGSGELVQQRWSNRALFDDEGKLIGYQAFGEDVESEYRMQELQSAMYRIAQVSYRLSSVEEVYEFIHQIIREKIPTQNLYIALYNAEEGTLELVYFSDERDELPPEMPFSRKLGDDPSSYVLRTGVTLHCTPEEYLKLMPEFSAGDVPGTPPAIWLGVPLMATQRVIGIIAVQDYESETAFSTNDREFLELLSTSIASVIIQRKSQESLLLYSQENAILVQAAHQISQTLDLETLYKILHRIIAANLPCNLMMISSFDSEEKLIHCDYLVVDDRKQDVSEYPPLPLNEEGEGTQSKVILTGKPILISNHIEQAKTSQNTYYIDLDGHLENVGNDFHGEEENVTRSAILVPLVFGKDVIGVIQVMSYELNAYDRANLRLLQTLANQIAISINNIRLFEKAQTEIKLRKDTETRLQELNLALEERVDERTAELNKRMVTVEKLNQSMANILKDLNKARQVAQKSANELHEANQELEAFAYSVSHDLRAPLRHIEGFTKILQKNLSGEVGSNAERYLENILQSTTRMGDLINALLALSRAGRMDFHVQPIDFNATVGSIRAELQDEVSERDITWKVATLPTTLADGALMKIAWTNLIRNAVKYSRTRDKAIIEIGTLPPDDAQVPPDKVVFFVRDNGVGFDPHYSDKLFGVFQRLHQQDEFEGNGIGLATVRRIIQRHGGNVWAEGKPDKGATFYFSLPQKGEGK